jgi:hypothetical protein
LGIDISKMRLDVALPVEEGVWPGWSARFNFGRPGTPARKQNDDRVPDRADRKAECCPTVDSSASTVA